MYGPGGHLGHMTSIISEIFIFMYLKAYIQDLVKNGKVVFEKKHVLIFIHKWPWAKVKK